MTYDPPPWYHAVVCAGCGTHPHANDPPPGSVVPASRQMDDNLEVRASEDGVEIETDDSVGSEIVLIRWDQAITVAQRIIQLARDRGSFT